MERHCKSRHKTLGEKQDYANVLEVNQMQTVEPNQKIDNQMHFSFCMEEVWNDNDLSFKEKARITETIMICFGFKDLKDAVYWNDF